MIARHWRGWTKTENADVYEEFLSRIEIVANHYDVRTSPELWVRAGD